MKDFGMVSIITPSYKSAQFIGATIESIQVQTYTNWELLITDDCSPDNSCEVIAKYAANDSRIHLFRLDKNGGAGVARNHSIDKATGRFIAFCDSDDRWTPDKLEKQLAFMVEKDCALSYTSYLTCDETGQVDGIVVCHKKETFSSMKRDDGMGFLTFMYDTTKVEKCLMPQMRKRQDYAYKLMLIKKTGCAFGLIEPLAVYRIRRDSISRNKLSLIKYNVAVYQKILAYSKLRALLTFFLLFAPNHIMKLVRLRIINS